MHIGDVIVFSVSRQNIHFSSLAQYTYYFTTSSRRCQRSHVIYHAQLGGWHKSPTVFNSLFFSSLSLSTELSYLSKNYKTFSEKIIKIPQHPGVGHHKNAQMELLKGHLFVQLMQQGFSNFKLQISPPLNLECPFINWFIINS